MKKKQKNKQQNVSYLKSLRFLHGIIRKGPLFRWISKDF